MLPFLSSQRLYYYIQYNTTIYLVGKKPFSTTFFPSNSFPLADDIREHFLLLLLLSIVIRLLSPSVSNFAPSDIFLVAARGEKKVGLEMINIPSKAKWGESEQQERAEGGGRKSFSWKCLLPPPSNLPTSSHHIGFVFGSYSWERRKRGFDEETWERERERLCALLSPICVLP